MSSRIFHSPPCRVSSHSGLTAKLSRDVRTDGPAPFIFLPLALSVQLAEFPRSSTADDFLMAALATVDRVASSLCSDNVGWGIRIATSANRAPTAPTATRGHVILRADGCARGAHGRSRVPNTRTPTPTRLHALSDSQIAPRAIVDECRARLASPRFTMRTKHVNHLHLYIIQSYRAHTVQSVLNATLLSLLAQTKADRRF